MSLPSFDFDRLHHAYCFCGDFVWKDSWLQEIQEKFSQYEHRIYITDTADMELITELHTEAIQKSSYEKPRLMILMCHYANNQAQHKLLKIIEEPSPGTIFMFYVPHKTTLLPTIMSRCVQFTYTPHHVPAPSEKIALWEMNMVDRYAFIDKRAQNKTIPLTRQEALQLLHDAEIYLKDNVLTQHHLISELYQMMRYLEISGSSPKMILEYMAYRIPTNDKLSQKELS